MTKSDFLLPLTPNLALVKDTDLIVQNIIQLFLTRPLENIYRPALGVGLEDYIFENGIDLFGTLQQPIIEQIQKYVPDFELVSLNMKQVNNILYVTVSGKVSKYAKSVTFEFQV